MNAVRQVKIKCNRCNYERMYPIHMKGEKEIHPSYCSNCGTKLSKDKS